MDLRVSATPPSTHLDQPPTGPTPEDLALIRNQITEIITSGGQTKKALFEASSPATRCEDI
jgi:hypothetical protein